MTDPLLINAIKAAAMQKKAINPRALFGAASVGLGAAMGGLGVGNSLLRPRKSPVTPEAQSPTAEPQSPIPPAPRRSLIPSRPAVQQAAPVRRQGAQLRDIQTSPSPQPQPQPLPQAKPKNQVIIPPAVSEPETYSVNPARTTMTRAVTSRVRGAASNFWGRMMNMYGRRQPQE